MATSKAQQKAVGKYESANYDKVLLRLPKGARDGIKAHAAENGMSLNAYIVELIEAESGLQLRETKEQFAEMMWGWESPDDWWGCPGWFILRQNQNQPDLVLTKRDILHRFKGVDFDQFKNLDVKKWFSSLGLGQQNHLNVTWLKEAIAMDNNINFFDETHF